MPTREDGSFVSDRIVRERSCRFKECVCTHTDCYDGWEDTPGMDDNAPAKRCARCSEAADMAATLADEDKQRRGSRRRSR